MTRRGRKAPRPEGPWPVVTFATPEYADDAARLADSCARHGHACHVLTAPSSGAWEENCGRKAAAIAGALTRWERFWYCDADQWLQAAPLPPAPAGPVALHYQAASTIRPEWLPRRYLYPARRYGHRILTGLIAWRRTPATVALAADWQARCADAPDEWDEQVLFQSCQAAGIVPDPLPEAYRVGGDLVGHASGSRRHWRMDDRMPPRKILLLGSGADLPAWWAAHGDRWVRAGFSPVAMNHAWRVPPLADLHAWLHPNDFPGPVPPPEVPRNAGYSERTNTARNWIVRPLWEPEVQTTFLHALCHLHNEAHQDRVRLIVDCVGCDMDYSGAQTHFYGQGAPDPLRFGDGPLAGALGRVTRAMEKAGHVLRNVGGHPRTRLPFARTDSPAVATQAPPIITPRHLTPAEWAQPTWTADRRIYLDALGRAVDAKQGRPVALLIGRWDTMPMPQAVRYGLVVPPAVDTAAPVIQSDP